MVQATRANRVDETWERFAINIMGFMIYELGVIWNSIWNVKLYGIILYNNKLTNIEGKYTNKGVDIQVTLST